MPNTSASGGWLQPTAKIAAPAEDDALDDLLQQAVVGITGLPGAMVRPRWQPNLAPEPPAPDVNWCAIGVHDEAPDDHAAVIHHGSGDTADTDTGPLAGGWSETQRHSDLTVLATFYGANARAFANVLRDGLEIAQNRDMLRANGLAFASVGKAVSMPELVSNRWRRRFDVMVKFRRMVQRSYAVRNINKASGEIVSDRGPDPVNNPAREPWQAP
jgi:hypothetical protein